MIQVTKYGVRDLDLVEGRQKCKQKKLLEKHRCPLFKPDFGPKISFVDSYV